VIASVGVLTLSNAKYITSQDWQRPIYNLSADFLTLDKLKATVLKMLDWRARI
jgi:hypothetical protein